MLKYAGHVTNDYALDFEITKLTNEAWALEMIRMLRPMTEGLPDEGVSSFVLDHKRDFYDVLKYHDVLPEHITPIAGVEYFALLFAAVRSKNLLVPDMYMYYIIHRLASNIEHISDDESFTIEDLERMRLRLSEETRSQVLDKMYRDCDVNLGNRIDDASTSCEELLKSIETQKYLDIFLPDWDFLILDEINTDIEILPTEVPKNWYTATDFFYEYSNPLVGESIML